MSESDKAELVKVRRHNKLYHSAARVENPKMRLTSIGLTVSSKTAKNAAVRRKINRF